MIYDEAEIRERVRLGEDTGCEFMQIAFAGDTPCGPRRERLADAVAALANTRGGMLLCGVADDGRVLGMTEGQLKGLESLIVEISTDSIKPPVFVHTHDRTVGRKPLLVVEIPEGEACTRVPEAASCGSGQAKGAWQATSDCVLPNSAGWHAFAHSTNRPFPTLASERWRRPCGSPCCR